MKLGTRPKALMAPIVTPQTVPTSSVAAVASSGGQPAESSTATSTPLSAVTEPTDRSILPVRMT